MVKLIGLAGLIVMAGALGVVVVIGLPTATATHGNGFAGIATWEQVGNPHPYLDCWILGDDTRGDNSPQLLWCSDPGILPEAANAAPVINSDPPLTATIGVPYQYQVEATDPDGDTLAYFLDSWPPGMAVNQQTGLVSWVPEPGQEGQYLVAVFVEDGESLDGGLNVTQEWQLWVE